MGWDIAAIITNAYMTKISATEKEKQIVHRDNLTEEMKNEYVPFCNAAVVGAEDDFGRIIQTITGDTEKISVGGVTMVGVMPIPWETIYAVGDNFTADDIFEVSTDGSVKKQGFAKIERIIVLKHDKDATEKKRRKQLEDLINYFAEVDSFHGRPIKYAESVIPPAVTMEAEAYEDFFGAEYEQHLIKTAHSLYPTHQMYEANV